MVAHEALSSDTLALTISGRIGTGDVTAAFEAVRVMPAPGKVNILVTVAEDMTPHWREALVAEWRRRAEAIALLRRAGRIALVAPQAWVRAAAWIEHLFIPGVDYRVFRPEEAASARSFVLGEAAA